MIIHEFGKLKIDKDGIIYHNDIPFNHEGTIKIFKKNIVKENNQYFVKIGKSKAPIEVEDVILWVQDIDIQENESKLKLYLSNDENIILINDTNLFFENECLYYKNNEIKAKFLRTPYNQLMNYLFESNNDYFFKIGDLIINIVDK